MELALLVFAVNAAFLTVVGTCHFLSSRALSLWSGVVMLLTKTYFEFGAN